MKNYKILRKCAFSLFIFSFFFLGVSCDKATLSESNAWDAVDKYLKVNPIYETVTMSLGEVKFSPNKDSRELSAYKKLAQEGYITFEAIKQKKKFLSKDSILTYEVKLTDKAKPWVLNQKKNQVEVKSIEYQLDKKDDPKIELTGKKSGKAILNLHKANTVFSILSEDNNPHTTFITQTFLLNFKKDKGWEVTKSKK